MVLSNSKQMRDADNTAIHVMGIPSDWLMKNAGECVARAAMEYMTENRRTAIFCGSGNNGGDGIAAAVYLIRHGIEVKTIFIGRREKMTDDTRDMETRLLENGGRLEPFNPEDSELYAYLGGCGAIIDAMFGIGLRSALRDDERLAAELINASGIPVVSADIPSGVEADTGRIMGIGVKASKTVTFSMAKPGHFTEPGCTLCGSLEIADIGIPKELLGDIDSRCYVLSPGDKRLPARRRVSHKGSYGRLLIIGGSVGYTGAVSLCGKGAVHAGAGLVSIGVPESIYNITAVKNDEAMPFPLPDRDGMISSAAKDCILEKLEKSDACIIGPGLNRSRELSELVPEIIRQIKIPAVVDADGLYALSKDMTALMQSKGSIVLTPHEGEFLRLGGRLTGDRIEDAGAFSREHRCILVLKGHRTICAFPDGDIFIINAGNPGMAKGGSGDVLSGIIGALLGQLSVKQAILTAVLIHSHGGDICAEKYGEYSMTPSDIIRALPEVMKSITDTDKRR